MSLLPRITLHSDSEQEEIELLHFVSKLKCSVDFVALYDYFYALLLSIF
jgi:hypothetical protein